MVPLFCPFSLFWKLLVYVPEVWLCHAVVLQMILATAEKIMVRGSV